MNVFKNIIVSILLVVSFNSLLAQKNTDTLSTNYWAFSINAEYKVPLFNFSKRFGAPKTIGIALNKINNNNILKLIILYFILFLMLENKNKI